MTDDRLRMTDYGLARGDFFGVLARVERMIAVNRFRSDWACLESE